VPRKRQVSRRIGCRLEFSLGELEFSNARDELKIWPVFGYPYLRTLGAGCFGLERRQSSLLRKELRSWTRELPPFAGDDLIRQSELMRLQRCIGFAPTAIAASLLHLAENLTQFPAGPVPSAPAIDTAQTKGCANDFVNGCSRRREDRCLPWAGLWFRRRWVRRTARRPTKASAAHVDFRERTRSPPEGANEQRLLNVAG